MTLPKKCLRLCPHPSKCLSERINWIISTIPHRISKILFVYGSCEFLAMQCWKAKLERPHFFKVRSGKITVCPDPAAEIAMVIGQNWTSRQVDLYPLLFQSYTSKVLQTLIKKSNNLQYNTLGCWDDRLIDQSKFFFFIFSCKIVCKESFHIIFLFLIINIKNFGCLDSKPATHYFIFNLSK